MITIPELPYVLFFVLVCGLLGMLMGLWKGARKKIAGISAIILSVIASMIVTPILLNSLLTEETVMSLANMFGFAKEYSDLVAASPSIPDLIIGIPVAIVAPIVFLVIYAVLRMIFRIITGIVTKVIFKKKNFVISRVIGMPLGFVQGVLSAMVVVIVIAGFVNTANNVTDTILEQDSQQLAEIQETVSEVDTYINIVADDPVIKVLDKTNFIYDSLNSFKFNGEKVVLKNELSSIVEAGTYVLPLMENTDFKTWGDAEFDLLETFVEKFGNSKILPKVSSELLSAACGKWANGETFMGIEAPKADETINPLLITLYATFKTSTPETIVVDLNTVVDILSIAGKYHLLEGTENIMSNLDKNLISELLTVISQNERFNVLVPEITNLGMRMLATALNLPANVGEVHANVTTSLSESINTYLSGTQDAAGAEQLKADVSKSLKSNGIAVSDDIANAVANTMASAFSEKDNVSQSDIESYLEDYAVIFTTVENSSSDTASVGGVVKLGSSKGAPRKGYDHKNMTYDQKIEALANIGVLDHYKAKFDLSAPNNRLDNGMTADQFVNYLINIYNGVAEHYDTVKELGKSEENPIVALKSPETIITTKVTTEDLLVNSESTTLSEKDIQNISEGFENVVTFINSYEAVGGEVTMENLSQLDLEAAGKALDLLADTDLLGGSVGAIADTLVSEVTGSDVSISDKIASGDLSFESLMTTVKDTTNVLDSINNSNKTEEEKRQAIIDLLLNLTPETSDLIGEIVTEDFVISYGAPKEYAAMTVNLLKTALYEMAHLSEADHAAEAEKIQYLLQLATTMQDSNKPLIGENGIFKTENDLFDVFADSKVTCATLKSITTDKNGNIVRDPLGIASKLSENDKITVEKEIIEYYNAKKAVLSNEDIAKLAINLNHVVALLDLNVVIE